VCLVELHKRYGAPVTKVPAPAVTWPHVLADTKRCHGGAVIASCQMGCQPGRLTSAFQVSIEELCLGVRRRERRGFLGPNGEH
jgi:hypothetical protein